ncbi:MAG: hypothetical protein ACFFEF_03430 [Candidatus Thorarchaeota archaeon]
MKNAVIVMTIFGLLTAMLVTPIVAETSESFEWAADNERLYKYHFYYWVDAEELTIYDEDFTLQLNTTDVLIPDPLDSWLDLPPLEFDTRWLNGTEAETTIIVILYSWSAAVPIGNWSLLSELTENRTIFNPMGGSGGYAIEAAVEINDWFRWGFNYTFTADEWDFEVHVAFTKHDGMLASFDLVAYDRITSDLFGIITAYRDGIPSVTLHPSDMTVEYGSTGNIISWKVYDDSSTGYEVFRDNESILTGIWDGGWTFANVSVDGLDVGDYDYRIEYTDAGGNSTYDEVTVTVLDTIAPSIDTPEDVSFQEGTLGNMISWSPSDLRPGHYQVFADGIIIATDEWDGGAITVNLDSLTMGSYNYTVIVYDLSGNFAVDTVIVNVTVSTIMLVAAGGGVAVLVGIAFAIKRR